MHFTQLQDLRNSTPPWKSLHTISPEGVILSEGEAEVEGSAVRRCSASQQISDRPRHPRESRKTNLALESHMLSLHLRPHYQLRRQQALRLILRRMGAVHHV